MAFKTLTQHFDSFEMWTIVFIMFFTFNIALFSYNNQRIEYLSVFHPIDYGYDQPFNGAALVRHLTPIVLFCTYHSIFVRKGTNEYLAKLLPPFIPSLRLYVWLSIALQIYFIAKWFFDEDCIGGGVVWNIKALGSESNIWLVRNIGTMCGFGFWYFSFNDAMKHGIFRSPKIIIRGVYGIVRHPLLLGALLMLWTTPFMTVQRLVFAIVWTVYIWIGIYLEERDLICKFGAQYTQYSKIVPKLLPYRLLVNMSNEPTKQH
eukprot:19314_1